MTMNGRNGDRSRENTRAYGEKRSYGEKHTYGEKRSNDGEKRANGGKRSYDGEKRSYGERNAKAPSYTFYEKQPKPEQPIERPLETEEDEQPYLLIGRNAVREAIRAGRSIEIGRASCRERV